MLDILIMVSMWCPGQIGMAGGACEGYRQWTKSMGHFGDAEFILVLGMSSGGLITLLIVFLSDHLSLTVLQ